MAKLFITYNLKAGVSQLVRAKLWQRFRDTALQACLEQAPAQAAQLLEKLHDLEPLDITIIERWVQVLRELRDPQRLNSTIARVYKTVTEEVGEIPLELQMLEVA